MAMSNSLYFFSVSKGEIVSSRRREQYRTFREVEDFPPRKSTFQTSDRWLVDKLREHYFLINRRRRRSFWELNGLRTIGFAIFIRVCAPFPVPMVGRSGGPARRPLCSAEDETQLTTRMPTN